MILQIQPFDLSWLF